MTLALYGKSPRRQGILMLAALIASLGALLGGLGYLHIANAIGGAIYTTTSTGQQVNANLYANKSDVYLNGGPTNDPQCSSNGLDPGDYYFQVTVPSGAVLSSDSVAHRQIVVNGSGVVAGVSGAGNHLPASQLSPCGSLGVQLMPYDDTTNSGGEYSVNIYPKECVDAALTAAQLTALPPPDLSTLHCATKNDNFKVGVVVTLPSLAKSSGSFNTSNDTATWTITVTNTGANATSQDVVITDTGATLTAAAGGGCGSLPDTDGTFNCTVAAGGTLSLTVTKVIGQACTAGSVTNTASATAGGLAIINSPVTSSPALVIPADETLCALPSLAKGSGSYNITNDTATWTITVANTGANAISRDVVVTDSGATLTAVSGGSCTGTLPDTDGTFNCTVAGGGTLLLTVTKVIAQACAAGSVTNTASATVGGVAIQNSPVTTTELVIPADTSLCPLPSLAKDSGSYSTANDTATWTVTIDNTGADAISRDVVIADSGATMTAFSGGTCSGSLPNTDGTFNCAVAAGDVLSVTVTRVIGQACAAGTATNTASATVDGNPIVNSPVTSAPALVIPADEALCSLPTLSKSSGGYDTANDTATWTITIANTSANAISRDVVVTDSAATLTAVSGGSCTGTLPDTDGTFNCTVAGGGTLTLTVTKVISQTCAAGSVTNTASATVGDSPIQNSPVTSSPALVIPADTSLCPVPGINIQKTPDSQTIVVGGTANFTITVTNTGNVTLTNVTVSDALAPGCGRTAAQFDALDLGTFDPGDVVTYSCALANVQSGFTNSATVTGAPPTGPDLTATDTAVVIVQAPSIGIQKTPESQTVVAGGTATFTITVTNTGTVTLSNVSVSDAQAPGCSRSAAAFDALDLGTFDSGDVVTYTCSLAGVQASFVNSATATGTPPTGPSVSATDTANVTVVIAPVVIVVPVQTTATAVPPTATPVPSTPTPIISVQGERTPGPVSTAAGEKTPGPPQTGSGVGSQGGSINIFLAVLGLLVLSAGLTLVALGRGKHRA